MDRNNIESGKLFKQSSCRENQENFQWHRNISKFINKRIFFIIFKLDFEEILKDHSDIIIHSLRS